MSTVTRVRDFTYIRPKGRRLTEYEAVTCHVQVDPDDPAGWDGPGWFALTPAGDGAWRRDSTALRHPDWHSFRDPAQWWNRPYTRNQGEAERAIAQATADALAADVFSDTDPAWLQLIVRDHYRVWSFVEYAVFRAFSMAQRETLSDTLSQAIIFEAFDRMRHAQSIVLHLKALEDNLPGIHDTDAKQRWLGKPCYQPLRRIAELIMCEIDDWAQLAVATNLILDPLVSEVATSQLVRRPAAFNGDPVTGMLVAAAERDRRRNLAWTVELVRMVTDPDVPAAPANRAVIGEWLARWTPLALAAAGGLAVLFDDIPSGRSSFEQAAEHAMDVHERALAAAGLEPYGGPR